MLRPRQILLFVLVTAVAAIGPSPAHAWWHSVHQVITQDAIDRLPPPLRGFFETNRDDIVAMTAAEPPGRHYINIDVYPEFFAGSFPRDVDDLIAIYGWSFVTGHGRAPWTTVDYLHSLSAKMATAENPQNWIDLRSTAAALAHYAEDLQNPLHLTRNYDGQLTGNGGIHARYEGAQIEPHFQKIEFAPAAAEYLLSPLDHLFDGIDAHYPLVDAILAADDLAMNSDDYYQTLWAETGGFTQELLQEASQAVADLWLTAWVDAGQPRTFTPFAEDFNGNGSVGGEDLSVWQRAYGLTDYGDANRDGVSAGADFMAWQIACSGPASSATATPEPSAAAQGLAGLLGLFACQRRLAAGNPTLCRS